MDYRCLGFWLQYKDEEKFQRPEALEPHEWSWSSQAMRRTCKAADVRHFSPGRFHHYRASRWVADDVPLTTIQGRRGHSRATTTDNYLAEIGEVRWWLFPQSG